MKLLDPFAGYRLASGHYLFHIALFAGSYCVLAVGEEGFDSSKDIIDAFNLLRWGHFTLFMLAIFEMFANRPSNIPEKTEDAEANIEEPERAK